MSQDLKRAGYMRAIRFRCGLCGLTFCQPHKKELVPMNDPIRHPIASIPTTAGGHLELTVRSHPYGDASPAVELTAGGQTIELDPAGLEELTKACRRALTRCRPPVLVVCSPARGDVLEGPK